MARKPSTQTHLHPRTKNHGTSSPADQGFIEPGARQSVQGHTQHSTTNLPFPLNSRCMKAVYLRRVAEKLGLPSNTTANDLRQIVESKLREMGHEPGDLQVAVEESPTTETLRLLNAYGPIITVWHNKPLQDLEEETDHRSHPTRAYCQLNQTRNCWSRCKPSERREMSCKKK